MTQSSDAEMPPPTANKTPGEPTKTDLTDADPDRYNVADGPLENDAYVHPGYVFSGGNLGGQSIQVCNACWSLVPVDFTQAHTGYHAAQMALAER